MTSKYSLDELRSLWKRKERTSEQMLGQFFVYLKDHEQLLGQGEAGLEVAEINFQALEERLEALEAQRATTRRQLAAIMGQLSGEDQE